MILKFFLNFCSVLFISYCGITYAVKQNSIVSNNEEFEMSNSCDLSEDVSVFRNYILNKYDDKILTSTIDKLHTEFDIIKDKNVIDSVYSRTEKIRLVGLSKKCTASDGIIYEWQIAATINKMDVPVLHQLYLIYKFKDIYEGKRIFSFEHFHGSNSDYSKLISKETVGILNRAQFVNYMKKLGAVLPKKNNNNKNFNEYIYSIHLKEDMASRLAHYSFSKRVIVKYNQELIVEKVTVKNHQ